MCQSPEKIVRSLFVDEAGDTTLFGRGGKILVGSEGCSKTFMLGLARIDDPESASVKLEELRQSLLGDSYLKDIPSMAEDAGKTALYFHAKDDCPEVRQAVFKLIATLGVNVCVAIRRKLDLAKLGMRARRIGAKAEFLGADRLYDDLVKRLMRDHLHQADETCVTFARRGKSARIHALRDAILKAKKNFRRKWGHREDKPTDVRCAYPSQSAGLQIIDYYLWALQRLYERGESRFFDFVRDDYKLIMDLDDTTNNGYGEYYSSSNPLSIEKIKAL